mmetsp:Transcript_1673/g.5389  ORF Transcript_1673/g.5389 Transcript_1673/m.5389 type:complete len:112 (-) Transcript_1673:2275-2610(-)
MVQWLGDHPPGEVDRDDDEPDEDLPWDGKTFDGTGGNASKMAASAGQLTGLRTMASASDVSIRLDLSPSQMIPTLDASRRFRKAAMAVGFHKLFSVMCASMRTARSERYLD